MSLTPRFFRSVRTLIQNFAPLTTSASPEPQNVLLARQRDPDRGIDGPVRDLTITDLDNNRINEDRRINALKGAVDPFSHLRDDLVRGGPSLDVVLGGIRETVSFETLAP